MCAGKYVNFNYSEKLIAYGRQAQKGGVIGGMPIKYTYNGSRTLYISIS